MTTYQPYVSQYISFCCYCNLNFSTIKSSTSTTLETEKQENQIKPSDSSHYFHGCYYGGNQTKFLCDSTLSKLCRWLRVLGLNAAMHRPSDPPTSKNHKNNGHTKKKKPSNGE